MTDTDTIIQAHASLSEKIAQAARRAAELELELGELHAIIGDADGRGTDGRFTDRLRALLAVQWAPGNALQLVAEERMRQRLRHSEARDDLYTDGQLAVRGAELAVAHTMVTLDESTLDSIGLEPDGWGLIAKYGAPIRQLTVAAALILAEIERLQRSQSSPVN